MVFFALTESNPLSGLAVPDVVNHAEKGRVPELQWPAAPFLERAQELTELCGTLMNPYCRI